MQLFMKTGIVLYIPYLSPQDFLPTVSRAIETGFRHVEIPDVWTSWERGKLNKLKNELLWTLEAAGVTCSVHTDPFYEAHYCAFYRKVFRAMVGTVKETIKFAHEMDADIVTFHPLLYKGKLNNSLLLKGLEHAKKMFSDAVVKLTKHARDYGIRLGLESFCWESPKTFSSIFSSPTEFLGFVEGLGSEYLGITLDTGHAFQHGVNISNFVKRCKGLIINVHIHDSDGKAAHLPVGEGKIDFTAVVKSLKQVGYSNTLSLELLDVPLEKLIQSKNKIAMIERSFRD